VGMDRHEHGDGLYSSFCMVHRENRVYHLADDVVQMDIPETQDRPASEPRMEIPLTHQPFQYSPDGIYSINGLAFLNYEQLL